MKMIENSLVESLDHILSSLKIKSSYYIFEDEFYDIKSIKKTSKATKFNRSSLFAKSMQQTFYQVLHCRNPESPDETIGLDYHAVREFIEDLSQANTSKGKWEYGWEIIEIMEDGNTIKVKNDEDLILFQNISRFRIPEKNPKVGQKGSVLMPKEMRQISYGFYTLFGDATDDYPNDNTIRIYWNINYSGAEHLIKYITRELNEDRIPFQFKTLSNPFDYKRTDSAVLYIKDRHLGKFSKKIGKIYDEVQNFINPATSVFVK
jgi:hypothetical protein